MTMSQIYKGYMKPYPDNSPPGQFPSIQVLVLMGGFCGWLWSWWGVVLVGNCPRYIMVLVGNSWTLFLSGGNGPQWGVVLEPHEAEISSVLRKFVKNLKIYH